MRSMGEEGCSAVVLQGSTIKSRVRPTTSAPLHLMHKKTLNKSRATCHGLYDHVLHLMHKKTLNKSRATCHGLYEHVRIKNNKNKITYTLLQVWNILNSKKVYTSPSKLDWRICSQKHQAPWELRELLSISSNAISIFL